MSGMIFFLKKFIQENHCFYSYILTVTILNVLFKVGIPLYFKFYLDRVQQDSSLLRMLVFFGIFMLLTLASNVISVFWHYLTTKLGVDILFRMRADLSEHLEKCSDLTAGRFGLERLKYVIYYDTLEIFRSAVAFVTNLIANSLVILLVFVVLYFFDAQILLFVVLSFFAGLVIANFSRTRIEESSRAVNTSMKELSHFFNVFIDCLNLNRSNLLHGYFHDRHQRLTSQFQSVAIKNDMIQVFLKNLLDNANSIFSLLVISYLSIQRAQTSAGDAVLIIFYSGIVFSYAQSIESLIASIGAATPSFKHLDEVLGLACEKRGTTDIGAVERISLREVRFSYDGKRNVIDIENLDFSADERVLITGPNGGGKSTLLNLLKGTVSPDRGEVLVNGIPLSELSNASYVSQCLVLKHDDLFLDERIIDYYRIILGDPSLKKEQVSSELMELNWCKTDGSTNEVLDSLDYKLDHKGSTLSSGQRNKLLLVKMLLGLSWAKVIILDEMDANLDPGSKAKYQALKIALIPELKGKIFFEISHQSISKEEKNRFFTHHIMIENGRVTLERFDSALATEGKPE